MILPLGVVCVIPLLHHTHPHPYSLSYTPSHSTPHTPPLPPPRIPPRRIHDEVKLVNSSPRLATLITQSIGSALITLAGKAEYMAVTGPDARTLGSGATAAQQRNITLVNGLQEVHRSMVQLLQKLPPEAHGHLRYGGAFEGVCVRGGGVVYIQTWRVVVESHTWYTPPPPPTPTLSTNHPTPLNQPTPPSSPPPGNRWRQYVQLL